MVRKQGVKNTKRREVSKAPKKNTAQKKQCTALLKTAQSKLKQLNNYKAFIKFLLSRDFDRELADDTD